MSSGSDQSGVKSPRKYIDDFGGDRKVVRLSKGKNKIYEVIVREGVFFKYREGDATISEVVISSQVFQNASMKTTINEHKLLNTFETDDMNIVLDTILQKGTLQQGTEEVDNDTERLRKEIIQNIHDHFVSTNGEKVPLIQIENAIEKVDFQIDTKKSPGPQAKKIVVLMKEILEMKSVTKGKGAIVTIEKGYVKDALKIIQKHGKVDRCHHSEKKRAKNDPLRHGTAYKVTVRNMQVLKNNLEAEMDGSFEVYVTS